MANPNPSPETRFKPGESGNPGGRPAGVGELKALVAENAKADWEIHGAAVLAVLRETDPAAYVRVIAQLIPKESKVGIEHSGAVEHRGMSDVGARIGEMLAGRTGRDSPTPLQD
jgi:hypothetical protein